MKRTLSALLGAALLVTAAIPAGAQLLTTYAGTGIAGYTPDVPPVAATMAAMSLPYSVAAGPGGDIYIADYQNHRIRKVSATTGQITTVAGTGLAAYIPTDDGGPATAARISWPTGMAFDASGNMYFCDMGNNIVRKVSTTGIITTVAGTPGSATGFAGDGGPATMARLGSPLAVAIHPVTGNLLIADQLNHAIRSVNAAGVISSIAGNGLIGVGMAGDGGAAAAARLNEPTDVAVDAAGNIYIADNGNNRIRKINYSTGVISTVVGVLFGSVPGSIYGYTGDGGPATAAKVYYPKGITVDGPGNIYIADWNNHVIRKVNTSGIINTLAGTGTAGYSGDGGLALLGQFNYPTDVAVRTDGDVFVADYDNNRIRRIKIGNEPYFTAGETKNVVVCPIEFTVIDSALKVDDIDVGQTLTWSPVVLPAHGTLVATYSTASTGSTVTPVGLTYAPAVGYTGADVFSVRVNDGTYSDTITINVDVLPPLMPGTISGADSVCPGQTVTLTSSVTGGTWSTSSAATATVSATGAVTGVAAGTVNISYTITDYCGSASAVKTISVIGTIPCVNAVQGIAPGQTGIELVPNPATNIFDMTISTSDGGMASVVIWDVTGRNVGQYTIPANKPTPIRSQLRPGVYLVDVHTATGRATRRLVIE